MKLLPALLLAACCTCPEPEPEPVQRLADSAAIHSSLLPYINLSTAAFISSMQWVESSEIPLPPDMRMLEGGAAALYMRAELVMFRPGTRPEFLAHEVLHGYWEHNLVPDQNNFVASINSMLAGTSEEHEGVRDAINGIIQEIRQAYPDRLFDTELYSYVGNLLIAEPEFHVPHEILRHYNGILNPQVIARRSCTPQTDAAASPQHRTSSH